MASVLQWNIAKHYFWFLVWNTRVLSSVPETFPHLTLLLTADMYAIAISRTSPHCSALAYGWQHNTKAERLAPVQQLMLLNACLQALARHSLCCGLSMTAIFAVPRARAMITLQRLKCLHEPAKMLIEPLMSDASTLRYYAAHC